MEALVHLDPERCICVLGPQVSAQYLVATGLDPKAIPAVMSHRGLVEAGIRKLVEVETFPNSELKQRKETLLRSSYELDPTFPSFKVTEKLRELGEYERWLSEAFAPVCNRSAVLGFNATLEHLTSLQRQGMLLAYSHYDPVLLNTQRFRTVLMDDEEGVREWMTTSASGRAASGTSSLLYLHGSLDVPSSMRWDSVAYSREVGDSPGGKALKEICKTRCVIFLGFDADFFDPLIQKFCTTFLPAGVQTPSLLLSTQLSHQPVLPSVLTVRVGQLALEKILLPVPTSQQGNTAHLYTAQDKQKCIHVTLLYSDNGSGLNAADKIKSMGSVGATQITLTQDGKHHLLGLHTDSSGMENLWRVVCGTGGASTAIQSGLLAVRLEGGVTMWLSSSSGGGGGITKAGEAIQQSSLKQERTGCSAGHPAAVPSLPLHSSPHVHNSTVSVISSHWASPIPSPSVTKLGSTPSPSTRPTLPSPLMNSTTKGSPQRTVSLANFEPLRGLPISVCPTPMLTPQQMHQQMRRIQSEHGGRLSYLERHDDEKRKRNGMLIHQESAPAIIVNDGTRTLSVPSPSTLAKLQSAMNEHRIECVDQLTYPPTGSSSSSPTGKSESQVDFAKLRQQFISDALEWSKRLSLPQQQQAQQRTQPEATTCISTVGMSMEDQEKLLSQHFEKMHKQQQTSSPSLTLSSGLSSFPVTLPVTSPQNSRPRSKSPKPSPIQLPSTTAPTISPLINPYGFLPTTSGLPGLQIPATATNLLFNPSSHTQYAALLNQYFQMMSSQSMAALAAGNKQQQLSQQPLIISDPNILQSLQQAIVVLPDGTIAPANLNLDSMFKKDSSHQQASSEPIKSPSSAGKRTGSPNGDASRLGPPPKRRRSSSLPDITQLPSVVDKNAPIQEEREAEEREAEEVATVGRKEENKRRNIPPLSMIQIPKEVKMHDPLLGFPTPPQSSPHFASSPLIPNVMSTMFQPHPMTPITPGQDSFNQEEIKELVGETSAQTPLPASPNGCSSLPPFPTGRGPIQLWQFLLDLLISPDKSHLIHWTGNGYEFRILLPEDIAKLWGARKNKPRMNYDKLSRGLRYYYSKGIMDKVPGKKLTFKYTCDVPNYLQSRGAAVRAVSANGKTAMSTEA